MNQLYIYERQKSQKYSGQNMTIPKLHNSKLRCLTFQKLSVKNIPFKTSDLQTIGK